MTSPDPWLARINALGTIIIAITVLLGGGYLIRVTIGNEAAFTIVVSFVTGAVMLVIGHFFGMRAATLGQTNLINGMLLAQPTTVVKTPELQDHPSTTLSVGPTGQATGKKAS